MSETFQFQAEINQLMSLVINTFYSNKDVFLRELISNASDALDKLRHKALTDSTLTTGEDKFHIEIIPDKDSKTLTIRDTGIGMTRQELIDNLGTIARSGTKEFMEKLKDSGDISLIGAFGMGFYSAYLVADNVTVISKSPYSNDITKWESNAGGSFTVSKDQEFPITRGTNIVLHIKDDQLNYLEEHTIRELVKTYSNFTNYPIALQVTKTVKKEVENDEEEETVQEMESINNPKPIWTKHPNDVTEEEYFSFYKSISNDWENPLAVKHFAAEGQLEFKAVLFTPRRAPMGLFETGHKKNNIKLYVKKVFITDEVDDIIPDWLRFVYGVVDSEDLPLNISREILQQNKIIRVIKKNIIKKSLEMFESIAEEEENFKVFYHHFGKCIKLGVHEDPVYRERLSKLLRYPTSKSEGKLISLSDYVSNMKESQKGIYYITGENLDHSPFLEQFKKRDYEVLFMTEPMDEYCIHQIDKFDDKQLICITKGDIDFGDEKDDKKIEGFSQLCAIAKSCLGERIERAIVSNRLVDFPCILSTSQHGWSSHMEKIMKLQAMRDNSMNDYMKGKKTLEFNPDHKIIKALKEKLQKPEEERVVKDLVEMLYQTALIASGFEVESPTIFAKRIHSIIELGLNLEDEPEPEPELEPDTSDEVSKMEEVD